MAKKRLLVALIPETDLLEKITALATVLGKSQSSRIPFHLTVIPPLNTDAEQLPYLRYAIRNAVENITEETLFLGPLESFWPKNPAVFLKAFSEPEEREKAGEVRVNNFLYQMYEKLSIGDFSPPQSRDSYSFMPHVTITHARSDEEVRKLVNFFSDYRISGTINSIALLEQDLAAQDKSWKIIDEPYFGKREKVNVLGTTYDICYEKILSPYDLASIGLRESQDLCTVSNLSLQAAPAVVIVQGLNSKQHSERQRLVIVMRNFLSAKANGILGAVIVDISGLVMYIRWIFVVREVRKTGVGLLLMRQAEKLAADCGCSTVSVFLPSDSEAVGFFERFRYLPVGSLASAYLDRLSARVNPAENSSKELCCLSKFLDNTDSTKSAF